MFARKLPMLTQPRCSHTAVKLVGATVHSSQVNKRFWVVVSETSFIGAAVSRDINVVALVKGEERYIFLFNDGQKSETLHTLGRYASDSKLSFSWYDAAVLSQKVRSISANQSPTLEEHSEAGRQSEDPMLFPENHFGQEEDFFSADNLFPEEDWF